MAWMTEKWYVKEAVKSSVERDWRKGNNLYPIDLAINSEDFVGQDSGSGRNYEEVSE